MDYAKLESIIKSYNDFPKPGILFRDIHPVMFDVEARNFVLEEMVKRYKGPQPPRRFINIDLFSSASVIQSRIPLSCFLLCIEMFFC